MRSVFSSSPERISDSTAPLYYGLTACAIAVTLLAGCQGPNEASRDVPDEVLQSVFIAGNEVNVVGGINLSTFYQSFLSRMGERFQDSGPTNSSFTEHHRELLDKMGFDPLSDNVLATITVEISNGHLAPSLVAIAPFLTGKLSGLADQFEFLDRIEVQLPRQVGEPNNNSLPIYALREEEEALMITQPVPGVLVATTSVPALAEMIIRSQESAPEHELNDDVLFHLVAGEDAWFLARNFSATLKASATKLPFPELQRIASAVHNVGASLRIESENVLFTLYLEPRAGVDVADVSDLVRGAIALVKMNAQQLPEVMELVEQVHVSDFRGFSRVQLNVTDSFFERLAMMSSSH